MGGGFHSVVIISKYTSLKSSATEFAYRGDMQKVSILPHQQFGFLEISAKVEKD